MTFSDSTIRTKTSPKYLLVGARPAHYLPPRKMIKKVQRAKYITKNSQSIQNKQHKQGKLKATIKDRKIGKQRYLKPCYKYKYSKYTKYKCRGAWWLSR